MEPVYRSARLLREQLKAGASLGEFSRLRGNFAAELSIVRDRAQAKPETAELLRPYLLAYGSALEAYALVGEVWEYRASMDACTGPEPADHTKAEFDGASIAEKKAIVEAETTSLDRSLQCIQSAEKASKALDARSKQLAPQCGGGFDCIIKNADGRLTAADRLFAQR
jgi:hypothetical protein